MKFVVGITETELKTLEDAHKDHQTARVRKRAHVIILSNKGYKMQNIADICGLDRHAVSRVIDNWNEFGILGLYDAPRSGRPRILTPEDEEFVHELVEEVFRKKQKEIRRFEERREIDFQYFDGAVFNETTCVLYA